MVFYYSYADDVLHIPDVVFGGGRSSSSRKSKKRNHENSSSSDNSLDKDPMISASTYSLYDYADGMIDEEIGIEELLEEHQDLADSIREKDNAGNEEKSETGTVRIFCLYIWEGLLCFHLHSKSF